MRGFIDEMVRRPLCAVVSAIEMFNQNVELGQGIDGMFSRFAHNLTGPTICCNGPLSLPASQSQLSAMEHQSNRESVDQAINAEFTDEDWLILERVEGALADGRVLKRWWDRTYPNGFADKFELQRVFNRPATSFGFFDQVQLNARTLPVMGNFQEMFYDQPRTPTTGRREAASWMRDQLREFVLRYFMRVSAFRQPEVYVESPRPNLPDYLERLSWCTEPGILRQGFGFTQHYYKLRDTGKIGKFSAGTESAIIDLREIGEKYEWVVVKVSIFDFAFTFKLSSNGPELSIPLTEQSYLVLSRDFILNEDDPTPDCRGRYGFGYAFIQDPKQGLIGYGPGQFSAAIELINFDVNKNGEVRVAMVFVVNKPERIANVSLNPVDWSFRLADLFSFGMTSRIFAPIKDSLEAIPVESFDPVYGFVSLVNTLSANQAAQQLCISKEQLNKDFLAQHFTQHYVTLVGSLLTWRQIPNWLDTAALPEWVVLGRSS